MKIIKKPLILLISLLLSACLNQNIITTNKFENSNSETQVKNNLLTSNYQINDNKENEITFKDKTYKIGDEIPDELIKNYVFDRYKKGNQFTYTTYFNKVTLENGVEIKKPLDFSDIAIVDINNINNNNKVALDLSIIRFQHKFLDSKYFNFSTMLDFNDKDTDPILNFTSFYSAGSNDYTLLDSMFNPQFNKIPSAKYKFIDKTKKLIVINNKFETVDVKVFEFNTSIKGKNTYGKIYLSNKIGIQKVEFNLKEDGKSEYDNVELIFSNFFKNKEIINSYHEEEFDTCIKNSYIGIDFYKRNFVDSKRNTSQLNLPFSKKLPCELQELLIDQNYLYLGLDTNIPEKLLDLNLKNLKKLEIHSSELDKIPSKIENLTNLENLSIRNSGKNILELPKEIGSLAKLKDLKIVNLNNIVIPKEIGNLLNLKKLEIYAEGSSTNNTIPNEIGNLKSLENLGLFYVSLANLGGISELQNLKNLMLYSNYLTNLEEVDVLKALENLNLAHNKLKKIPESILNSNSLVEVNLSYNQISDLPYYIKDLKNLERLDLSNNQITTIPSEISNLKKLNKINLSNNQIEDFSNILNIPDIHYINLESNKIKNLPIDKLMKIKSYIYIYLDIKNIPNGQIEQVKKNRNIHLESPSDWWVINNSFHFKTQ